MADDRWQNSFVDRLSSFQGSSFPSEADKPRQPLPPRPPLQIDLKKVTIPIMAINGELDHPYEKTFRLWRELNDFTNVILPGKSHLTSIAPATMPKEYLESLVRFIDSNDM